MLKQRIFGTYLDFPEPPRYGFPLRKGYTFCFQKNNLENKMLLENIIT